MAQTGIFTFVLAIALFGVGLNADLFHGGLLSPESSDKIWSSIKHEMSELEKAAEHMTDLMVDETKAVKKALLGPSEEGETPPDAAATPTDISKVKESTTTSGTLERATERQVEEGEDEEDDDENPFSGADVFDIFGHQFPSMFSILHANRPWWHGKNVCVDRQEKNETRDEAELGSGPEQVIMFGASQFTSCKQLPTKYICTTVVSQPGFTKTVTVTYQCCHGYRKTRKSQACTKVENKPIADALAEMGAKDFETMIKSAGLEEKLDAQNLTLFVPSDAAMKEYEEKMQENNRVDFNGRRRRAGLDGDVPEMTNDIPLKQEPAVSSSVRRPSLNNKETVLSQITPGLIELADFNNEKMLLSEHNSTLRLNVYPGKQGPVVTVNCALVTSADNYATNSVLHMVDRVLPVVQKNLLEMLDQPQFSEFRKLLETTDMLEVLTQEGPYTVFAPTNEAINKLDAGLKAKYSRGEACVKTVLRHHILGHTLCMSAANNSRISTMNLAGDWLHLHTDEAGDVLLNDKARVSHFDMVATNGVLHAVDKILSPKEAKPVSELLSATNHSVWLSLMERAGVIDELNNAGNLTMFVPSEAALNNTETRKRLEELDEAALRDVVLYHSAKHSCGIRSDDVLESFVPGSKLRINSYAMIPLFSRLGSRVTVECALAVNQEGKACNSVVYEVDDLLIPPNGTVLQVIESDPQLTTLKDVLSGTNLEGELQSLTDNSYTFLAPTNDAFKKLPEPTRKLLLEDKEMADRVLRRHVISDVVCCKGVTRTPWPFTKSVDTLSGKAVEVNRDNQDLVRFAGNKVTRCDRLATDGIVHHVANVFVSRNAGSSAVIKTGAIVFGNPGTEVRLYGV